MNTLDYFARPEISNSKLEQFKKSPLHFKWSEENKQVETPAMTIGSATHKILFEPATLEKEYFILDLTKKPEPEKDFRDAKNKAWKADELLKNAGKKELSSDEYETIRRMQDALHAHSQAMDIISGCQFEQEIYWTEPETKTKCKSKLDGKKPGLIFDYKTTADAQPYSFCRSAFKMGYHRQGAFYTDAELIENHNKADFYFIAQEKIGPFAITVLKVPAETIQYGRGEYLNLLRRMEACKQHNCWPGYEIDLLGKDYFELELPEYAR